MRRRRTLLAGILLVLALAFAVLQFTTFRTGYFLSHGVGNAYTSNADQYFLMAQSGCLCGGWRITMTEPAPWQAYPIDPQPIGHFGFSWSFYSWNGSSNWVVGVPFWLLACIAGAIGLYFFRTWKVPTANLCAKCGYDLRATRDRCPECGAVPVG